MSTIGYVLICACLLIAPAPAPAACDNGLAGWDVITNRYQETVTGNLDGITFQWDYFMVHDDDFTGSIGYVVADPRLRLVGLMPSGGNAAISGKFLPSGPIMADYVNFGITEWTGSGTEGYSASAEIREFHAEKDGLSAHIIPLSDNDTLLLQGRTAKYAWDLTVSQDWQERCDPFYLNSFPVPTGNDVGNIALFPGEHWSVDMNWLRTKVTGTITDLTSDPPFAVTIDGHGYREQAWGPWAFNFSGWDFVVLSDEISQVQWALQTYHHSEPLDYLDVSFYDDGLVALRFSAQQSELGWHHPSWQYDTEARQCVPTAMIVRAENEDYIIEAEITIGNDQVPMLSNMTPVTDSYVIVCRFPQMQGSIRRTGSGELLTTFSGQAGGEFSIPRRPEGSLVTPEECARWGGQFAAPLPTGCIDLDGDGYGYAGSPDCALEGRDCDDTDGLVNPGSAEQFGNNIDDNCDGTKDENLRNMWRKLYRSMLFFRFLKNIFS
ncbi:MAG: hypothetical protein GY868_17560 [Deltaproteobacteria bacterium]|nr:hypothetical protein [Deltaproteobacteria bacterium]